MKKKCEMRDSLFWGHLVKLVLMMKFTVFFPVALCCSAFSKCLLTTNKIEGRFQSGYYKRCIGRDRKIKPD